MDRIRIPASQPDYLAKYRVGNLLIGLQSNKYYHAKIYRNGKMEKCLKGKYNSLETLNEWLTNNWRHDVGWHKVEEWEDCLLLVITQNSYSLGSKTIVNAQIGVGSGLP